MLAKKKKKKCEVLSSLVQR